MRIHATSDTARLLAAANFAAGQHREQRRKGSDDTPYINHPLRVAEILAEAGVDDTAVLMAAVLHDTVEDGEATIEDVERLFGSDVAGLVSEVTDDKSLDKAERKRLQIATAPTKSERARLVKIADKIANLDDLVSCPPDWPIQRKRDYVKFSRDVIAGCSGLNERLDAEARRALEAAEKLG